jgi:outer membrane protein TolC
LRNSLLDFTAAGLREELLRRQLGFQEQIVGLLTQRLQAGAVSSSELALTRVALEKTRLDLTDTVRLRAEGRQRVAESVGVPISALTGIALKVDGFDNATRAADLSSSQVRRQALLSRSDILQALADYAASQASLQLEIAKQYPDVRLTPGYQYDQGDNKWSLGLSVDLPVLNRNQGPIAEAMARRDESAARFNAVQAKVLAEIEHAVEVYRVTENTVSTLQSLAAAQRQQRESVEAQLKAGAADQLDLLNAQFEFSTGELTRLDGKTKLQQALALLEDAVQKPIFGQVEPQPDSEPMLMGARTEKERGVK